MTPEQYENIFNYISGKTESKFKHEYHWWAVIDVQSSVTSEWVRKPESTIKYAIKAALKRFPEEYNSVFEPLFTPEELKDLSMSLREVS